MFVEPSEGVFASAVRTVFDDLLQSGFHDVEPVVYGCTYANGQYSVSVTYDRRQRQVRTVLQAKYVVGRQPESPRINLASIVDGDGAGEDSVGDRLTSVMAQHLDAVRKRLAV